MITTHDHVIPLNATRARPHPAFPRDRDAAHVRYLVTVQDAIGQMILSFYSHCRLPDLARALRHGHRLLAAGGNIADIMQATHTILDPEGKFSERNQDLLAIYSVKLAAVRDRLQDIAAHRLTKLMADRPAPELAAAIERAHVIVNGGGNLAAAVYQGIKPLLEEEEQHDE